MQKSIVYGFLSLFLFLSFSVEAKTLPAIKPGQPLPANIFVELAKIVNPTVVNIYTSSRPRVPRGYSRQRDPFFDLFEQFMGPQTPQRRPSQALGTGFIIRKDGLILTNNHVVESADIIKVQMSGAKDAELEAEVVGRDARTDIALIKVNTKMKLPVAKLGTSSKVQVGEWVAAFGNPFGHGHSMSKGVVSALGREIDQLNRFPFIQTDASINPGNSGGPLVNLRGEVIGVNAAIDARAQGIGFAIPIDEVKSILKSLESVGHIKRGYLGIYLHDVDRSSAQTLNLPTTEGVLVTQVQEGGAADKAGLEPYDFITKFNGKKITGARSLVRNVADATVGKKVPLELIRNGKKKKLKITVGEHPDEQHSRQASRKKYRGQKAPYDMGFRVANPNRSIIEEYDVPQTRTPHPVVIDVTPGSPASQAGLARGDVILDINKRSTKKALDVIKRLKKKKVNILRVLRQEQVLLISIKSE